VLVGVEVKLISTFSLRYTCKEVMDKKMEEKKFIYIDCPRCKGHSGYITATGKIRCFVCGNYLFGR
jgi:ribosomal protein S27E